MDLYAVAERVVHKKALPRSGRAILNLHSSSLQYGSQTIHIPAPKPKMPLLVHPEALFLDRKMQGNPSGIEPDTATDLQGLRLRQLAQTQLARIEHARHRFAPFGYGDVYVRKIHTGEVDLSLRLEYSRKRLDLGCSFMQV